MILGSDGLMVLVPKGDVSIRETTMVPLAWRLKVVTRPPAVFLSLDQQVGRGCSAQILWGHREGSLCLSLLKLPQQNTPDWVAYRQERQISHSSGDWKSDQGTNKVEFW